MPGRRSTSTWTLITPTGSRWWGPADLYTAWVLQVRSSSTASTGAVFTLEQTLVASDGVDGDRFGWSVSHSAGRIFVGAPYHDSANIDESGAVYVYEMQAGQWTETASCRRRYRPRRSSSVGISISMATQR